MDQKEIPAMDAPSSLAPDCQQNHSSGKGGPKSPLLVTEALCSLAQTLGEGRHKSVGGMSLAARHYRDPTLGEGHKAPPVLPKLG